MIKVIQGLLNEKEYKEHKNKTRKMMRKAQEEYYKDLFDEKQNGMKQMWKHLGVMLNPKRSKGPHMIKRLLSDGTNITENNAIAETMNKHFCTIGNKLTSKILKSQKSFTHFLKSRSSNSYVFTNIDPKQILGIINALSSHKSPWSGWNFK